MEGMAEGELDENVEPEYEETYLTPIMEEFKLPYAWVVWE